MFGPSGKERARIPCGAEPFSGEYPCLGRLRGCPLQCQLRCLTLPHPSRRSIDFFRFTVCFQYHTTLALQYSIFPPRSPHSEATDPITLSLLRLSHFLSSSLYPSYLLCLCHAGSLARSLHLLVLLPWPLRSWMLLSERHTHLRLLSFQVVIILVILSSLAHICIGWAPYLLS